MVHGSLILSVNACGIFKVASSDRHL